MGRTARGWLAAVRVIAITDRAEMVAADLLARRDWPAIAAAFGAAIARAAARFDRDALIVQVREKDLDGAPLLQLARAALATGARVMVNDRLDVALAAGCHGVHLPERGLALADARALLSLWRRGAGDAPAIGVSRHAVDGARAAAEASADLVQLGPIWDKPGKGPALGCDALRAARAVVGHGCRLVALGGVTGAAQVREAAGAGADAVAAIRGIWSGALDGEAIAAAFGR